MAFDAGADMVTFYNRGTMKLAAANDAANDAWSGFLDSRAYEDARKAAPGWDVYHLEQEWRLWLGENEIIPKQPEKHFVKFCATWFEKRGRP